MLAGCCFSGSCCADAAIIALRLHLAAAAIALVVVCAPPRRWSVVCAVLLFGRAHVRRNHISPFAFTGAKVQDAGAEAGT